MIRGLYTAIAGMVVQTIRQQTIAANIANVNTIGFKRDVFLTRQGTEHVVPREFERLVAGFIPVDAGVPTGPAGVVGAGVLADPVRPEFAQGELRQTGRPFDLALSGPGFFVIRNAAGEALYTRAGNFSHDAEGRLVTARGQLVVGSVNGEDGQPIQVGTDPAATVAFTPTGGVVVNGQEVGRLAIVDLVGEAVVRKLGENAFAALEGVAVEPAERATVVQEHVEMSNVNPNDTLIEMTAVMRAYEANQR
ncbi:MAG: flagellar hook-basal body protein, partial [Chloroflexi bacterium]|nr:flagellar hook-basal body protein [Chloroflexota bacterium]